MNQFANCVLCDRNDIYNVPNIDAKYESGAGLCNQMFNLINGILKEIAYGANNEVYMIIDCFLCCIKDKNIMPISEIIDLEKTANNLFNMFNKKIILVDRMNINFSIINAKYGNNNIYVDVTDNIKKYNDGNIHGICDMNDICGGDPLYGVVKKLIITYELEGKKNEITINENVYNMQILTKKYLLNEIFNHHYYTFLWYNAINENLFEKIIKTIAFSNKFNQIIDIIGNKFNNEKHNIVHFRVENDAILHWSRQNNMDKETFKVNLFNKYNSIFDKYINGEPIYVLSDDVNEIGKYTNNRTIKCFSQNDKDTMLLNFFGTTGRELRAIIDLLYAIKYAKFFIGCHNMELKRGSTFSYIIMKSINCKKVCIDLDNINDIEQIY